MGYAAASKDYRVYNLTTQKVQVCRDVIFDENSHWNWELKRIEKDELEGPLVHSAEVPEPALANNEDEDPNSEALSESSKQKIRLLSDIYENCNFMKLEPSTFEEAENMKNGKMLCRRRYL